MLEIRPYTEEDYLAVKSNLHESGMFDAVCDAPENLAAMVANHPEAALVADLDHEIVGSIVTAPFGINVALIFRLVVARDYREEGIGSQLLTRMEESIRFRGFKEIWLFSEAENDRLTAFYEQRGYRYNKDHKYYGPWKVFE